MKKNILYLLASFVLLVILGLGLHFKIQSVITSNDFKEQFESIYQNLDFPGKFEIKGVSFVFTKKLRIRLKLAEVSDAKSGFSFKASRVDAYIPYTSFITNRNDKIKFEIDRLEIKNISSFNSWYGSFLEKRKNDHKVEVMIPLYLIANSYDLKISSIHFLDYPLENPSTLILKGLGKKQKISFEIKNQNDHILNNLRISADSVVVGEGQIDQDQSFGSKFTIRSKISLITQRETISDELNSNGEFSFHPETGSNLDLKFKGETLSGDLGYSSADDKFKLNLLRSDISANYVLSAIGFNTQLNIKALGNILTEGDNFNINFKDDKNILLVEKHSKISGHLFSYARDGASYLKFNDNQLVVDPLYWDNLSTVGRLQLSSDFIKFTHNHLKIVTLKNNKPWVIMDGILGKGPCLVTEDLCKTNIFKSSWDLNSGDWRELIISSSRPSELKSIYFLNHLDWLSYLGESHIFVSNENNVLLYKFKTKFKDSKLLNVAFFKEHYLEMFMRNKSLAPLIESSIQSPVEIIDDSQNNWIMKIPVVHQKIKYEILLSVGKKKMVKVISNNKVITEETI